MWIGSSRGTKSFEAMSDAIIHLRVPVELKARWVRESRAAGMRLTDWIVSKVEAQPMHDLTARVQRLVREGAEWHQRNP